MALIVIAFAGAVMRPFLSIIELSQDLPSAGWSLLLRASYLARPLPETYLCLGVTLGLSSDYDSEDRMVVTRYLAR